MPSSAIRYFHYDAESRVLKVGYRPSGDYAYLDVPPAAIAALQAAESKGAYINTHIKPFYAFRRVSRRRDATKLGKPA